MIFIDADAYIGIYVNRDSLHDKAFVLLLRLRMQNHKLTTSWDVVDEVATKLSRHVSRADAKKFLEDTQKSDTHIVYMSELFRKDVVALFLKQTSKKVSMTDCANMVIAKNLGIKTFFSFDHHYEQNGFTLLS